METKRCAICNKPITKGYVWDELDVFCTKRCAAITFGGDMGSVNILMDDGRIEWKEITNNQ